MINNNKIKIQIKQLGINGEGIGYFKNKIVFVPGALPSELVIVNFIKNNSNYINAKLVSIIKKSKYRIIPKDKDIFGIVGGIELENLNYKYQLKFKKDIIKQSLKKFKPENYKNYLIKSTIGMNNPFYYRNKAQFHIKKLKNNKLICGLYSPNSHYLVNIKNISTQKKSIINTIEQIKNILSFLKIPIYDEKTKKGIIKTIIVRESFYNNEQQLTLVTNCLKIPNKTKLIKLISNSIPHVVSIAQNINSGTSSLIWGNKTNIIFGKKQIREIINGYKYDLSAKAFFQLNPIQTSKLYKIIYKAIEPNKNDILLDAYCGVGSLGISMAKFVKEVRGIDNIKESINDAKHNLKINNIKNAKYEFGDVNEILQKWYNKHFCPNALIVDPPRIGMDKNFIKNILKIRPKKIAYVSCNPSTLSKNLVYLSKYYNIQWIQPIDMFPQTPNVESVVKMSIKS